MATNALLKSEPKQEVTATPTWTRNTAAYTPRVDILENDDELTILADVPGVAPEDLDIRFEKNELVIHGRCQARREAGDYLLNEYGYGDFYRAFTIGEAVDPDKIAAELKNGVLTVHLPKSEAVKPKRIAVKSE
jgi:HSP20 family protein